MKSLQMPGDTFNPAFGTARERADMADELSDRPFGKRWRPVSGREVLVDNRRSDPKAPVLLKTSIFGSEIVTEWIAHHAGPSAYRVFEVDRMDETERHFAIEQVADALKYHALLEAAARRREHQRRRKARVDRGLGVSPAFAADLQRGLKLHPNMSAGESFPAADFEAALAEPVTPEDEEAARLAWPAFKARLDAKS